VIAEAMVCVRAVVVSRDDGAGEIVTPGEDALVHEAGSAPALAERMCQLSRRRFTREQLADELMPMYRLLSAQAAA
jgi:glycosyltransferase involved in cell wall biosynthesis